MSIYNQGFGGGMNPSITVTTTVGATVTVTLGTKSVTAIATGGTAKISVWDYGSYSIRAALGDATGDATVDVIAVQDYAVTVETVPIPTVLNNATWAQIKEVAEKSHGANYWAVGDTKQIIIDGKVSDGLTLSNYQTWVYIIGFDHNSEKEGTGIAFQGFKTAQTGGMDIALTDAYLSQKTSGQWFNMNNSQTTAGGWASCLMRTATTLVLKATLPEDLTSVIKTTGIYTDNVGGGSNIASNVTSTQDDLYLLAEYEIFGARTYANSAEQNYQTQYAYYTAGNSKIKYNYSATSSAIMWWLRSPRADKATSFLLTQTNGTIGGGGANNLLGLAPAFKVGG